MEGPARVKGGNRYKDINQSVCDGDGKFRQVEVEGVLNTEVEALCGCLFGKVGQKEVGVTDGDEVRS